MFNRFSCFVNRRNLISRVMKNIYLLLTLLFLSPALPAQQAAGKLNVFAAVKREIEKKQPIEIIGKSGTDTYVLLHSFGGYAIDRLNDKLERTNRVEIPLKTKYKGEKYFFSSVVMLGKSIYVLSTATDADKNTHIFAQQVNHETLFIDPVRQELLMVPYEMPYLSKLIVAGPVQHQMYRDVTITEAVPKAYVSPDGTKLLLYYNKGITADNPNERVQLAVFDSGLKKQWEKTAELPHNTSLLTIRQAAFDNSGNVYLAGFEYRTAQKTWTVPLTEQMEAQQGLLFAWYDNGATQLEFPIKYSDRYVLEMNLCIAANGDVVAAGFFALHKMYSITEAFYFSVDAQTRKVRSQRINPIPNDFAFQSDEKSYLSGLPDQVEGLNYTPREYEIRQFFSHADSTCTLVAEQAWEETRYGTPHPDDTTQHYFVMETYLLHFNSDGKLLWQAKVAKTQHTEIKTILPLFSYQCMAGSDRIYLLHNDFADTLNDKKRVNNNRGMPQLILSEVKLKDGSQTSRALPEPIADDMLFLPGRITNRIPGELFLYTQWNGRLCRLSRLRETD